MFHLRITLRRTVRRFLASSALFCLFFPAALRAQEAATLPEIEYASPDQSVWTTRRNARGEPDNPLSGYAGTLFARAGLRWHGSVYPAARLFRHLQDGKAQFSILVRAPALEQCCLFSRKPVAAAEIRVYFIDGKTPVRSPAELAEKPVITIHGYSYGGLLTFIADQKNRVINHTANSHQAAFAMLAQGRADYLIDYEGPASEVLAAAPIAGLRSELLARQEVFLVLSKTYPDAEKLMARLEAIAETLAAEKSPNKP